MIIDLTKCFECNKSTVELHHVIPKSLGGAKTIPLCESCHGKVHGLDRTNHAFLTKEALRKLKEAGKRFGNIPYGFCAKDNLLYKDDIEQNNINTIKELHKDNSIRKIIDILYENKIYNRAGKKFTVAAIYKIIKT